MNILISTHLSGSQEMICDLGKTWPISEMDLMLDKGRGAGYGLSGT